MGLALNKDIFMAFEVEDTVSKEHMIFLYDPDRNAVVMINVTDRNNIFVYEVVEKNFPFLSKNAYEYFEALYKKSIVFNINSIKFIQWINPQTLRPFSK